MHIFSRMSLIFLHTVTKTPCNIWYSVGSCHNCWGLHAHMQHHVIIWPRPIYIGSAFQTTTFVGYSPISLCHPRPPDVLTSPKQLPTLPLRLFPPYSSLPDSGEIRRESGRVGEVGGSGEVRKLGRSGGRSGGRGDRGGWGDRDVRLQFVAPNPSVCQTRPNLECIWWGINGRGLLSRSCHPFWILYLSAFLFLDHFSETLTFFRSHAIIMWDLNFHFYLSCFLSWLFTALNNTYGAYIHMAYIEVMQVCCKDN